MGLDIQTLVGASSSYCCLIHGLLLLLVIMLEVLLGMRTGSHRLVLHMPVAQRIGVALVVVSVVVHMWSPQFTGWSHPMGPAPSLIFPDLRVVATWLKLQPSTPT